MSLRPTKDRSVPDLVAQCNVTRHDVATGEMIGAENCEKCWPLRSVIAPGGDVDD